MEARRGSQRLNCDLCLPFFSVHGVEPRCGVTVCGGGSYREDNRVVLYLRPVHCLTGVKLRGQLNRGWGYRDL